MAVRAIAALRVNRGLISERDRLLVTDPLTGAFNRRFLQTEADRAFARASRGEESLSAIAFDLDRFKEVNDRLGHGVGDQLLRDVCREATANLRVGDLLCRMGGDEFLVLCPATRAHDAALVAERLRGAIAVAAGRSVPEVAVTASLGVATIPDDAESPEGLLRRADAALYAAKEAGRDRVVAFAGSALVA
jgi:two-component system cell cycle response regulator